jgi:hypothetical protein
MTTQFAWVHMPVNVIGVLLLGIMCVLPMTYLYLRRGFEAGIGFHITADAVKFLATYLAFTGIWFT